MSTTDTTAAGTTADLIQSAADFLECGELGQVEQILSTLAETATAPAADLIQSAADFLECGELGQVEQILSTLAETATAPAAAAWTVSDTAAARYVGMLETTGGELWQILETVDGSTTPRRLVFGGTCNAGFLESGFLEMEEGETTDEALAELLADLETLDTDGAAYTSRIVTNERVTYPAPAEPATAPAAPAEPDFVTLTLPAWLAPVLVNGDETGCDNPEDAATVDYLMAYLDREGLGLCVAVSDAPDFHYRAPIDAWHATGTREGGDFLEFTFENRWSGVETA